jgi:polysaccharide biosynthesis transport protein
MRLQTAEVAMANSVQIFSPEDSVANADGLSARALLKSMRRHWVVLATMLILFSLAGAAIGLGLPPHYKASGVLVIYSQPPRVADVQEVLPDQGTDMSAIASQADVLGSRSVIEHVVRSLALWRYPEFQWTDSYPGGWSAQTLEANLRALWAPVAGGGSPAGKSVGKAAATVPDPDGVNPPTPAQIEAAIGKYSGHPAVNTDGHSMTITVVFTAETPELAAKIVNAHMEAYRDLQRQDQATAAQRATAWLNVQIAKLRSQLQPAEAAVAAYRVTHHLTGTAEDQGALSGQLASLTSQLIAARADLAETEARAAEIAARASGKGVAANGPEAMESPTVQALKTREAALIERQAALSQQFGPAYPELLNVGSSLRDLRNQIGRETGRSYAAALELVNRSRAREQSIERSVDALTNQVNSSDAGLRQLQEKAESIRSLLQRFEKRMEETAAEPAFITSNSEIVTRAAASAVSISPVAKYLTIGSGFVGLIAGMLLALLLDVRDKTFQTSAQVVQHLEPRTIGATPRAILRGRKSPADLILNDHRSVFAEALRVSWANIHLAIGRPDSAASDKSHAEMTFRNAAAAVLRSGQPMGQLAGGQLGGQLRGGQLGGHPGTILGVTSAGAGEGKSMHALAFARTAAVAGENVVLVDADLRRSGVSRLFEENSGLTLNDFLAGRCTPADVVAHEQRSGMHFVPSVPAETSWTTHDFHRFGEMIDYLKKRFAIVIVDLPPVLGLAETVRLAIMTNGVVFIVRWGRSDRDYVRMAFETLNVAGVATTTVILNDVDLRAQRRRNYRDHAVAYSLYGKLYA